MRLEYNSCQDDLQTIIDELRQIFLQKVRNLDIFSDPKFPEKDPFFYKSKTGQYYIRKKFFYEIYDIERRQIYFRKRGHFNCFFTNIEGEEWFYIIHDADEHHIEGHKFSFISKVIGCRDNHDIYYFSIENVSTTRRECLLYKII